MKELWGKIAYIWFVFMLVIVGFFSGSLKVKADTNANYSSIRMDVEQCTVRPNGSKTAFNNCQWDNTNGLGSGNKITFGSTNGYLRKIQFQFYGGSNYTYPAGSYRVQLKLAQDPLDLLAFTDYYNLKIYGNSSSSSSGASSGLDTITSKSCSFSRNSTYIMTINCAFTTSRDLKYLNISFEYFDDNDVRLYNTTAIFWDSIDQFTYSTDSTGAINNQTTIIQNGFNEIDSTLNDDDIDSPNSMISDFEDLLPSNGVITQLIALPITLYQKVLNSINGTCSSFNLGSLYGTNLVLPCIELSNILGSSLVNIIDLMISGFFILHISKKMVKAFESFTSMKEGDVIDD